jgi:oligopeptide/dipeptide ABC transporter ATP-binding protein
MTGLLDVSGAVKRFATASGSVQALGGIDLTIAPGETLGLVGESGCGKSTLAKAVIGLVPLTAGSVRLGGELIDAAARRSPAWRARVQMVFQDPSASLNPRSTIGRILEEPLIVHRRGQLAERRSVVAQTLEQVGLRPDLAARYPHELSGGQKQRVGIGRALILRPELVICDEPVSALDVSVQAQIINLLLALRQELRLTYLFISHDLDVVRHVSHRVGVMYLGRLVELAPRDALWQAPLHPYTRALMKAAPSRRRIGSRPVVAGELPSALAPPSGCHFHPRCPLAQARCRADIPPLRQVGDRQVACHFA